MAGFLNPGLDVARWALPAPRVGWIVRARNPQPFPFMAGSGHELRGTVAPRRQNRPDLFAEILRLIAELRPPLAASTA
jgi:hypothetical protein